MKKLLLATTMLLSIAGTSRADIVVNLGNNPTSGTGAFSNTDPGTGGGGSGAFADIYTFTLSGGPQIITIASVTNTFASLDQFIAGFTGAVLDDGPDNTVGGGDDSFVIGPVMASACIAVPNCQFLAGSALLDPGGYYLLLTGTAGVNAGYGGNISTFAVPFPLAGAGLPGLIAGCLGLLGLSWHRRRRHA